jgi:DNA-binding NarL/FixJ family response regulator
MKKNIIIVDDHLLIAKALSGVIANFETFEVICECDNGKSLIHYLSNAKTIPDIVLLDISMPEMDGFETALWLKEHHPEIMVLALSMQNDEQSVIQMIKNGAKGYLLKNAHPKELEFALEKLVEKGQYFPDWASSIILQSIVSENKSTHSIVLSDREKEFLKYVVTELTYKEIADKMFCSPRTVESYRDSLFEKLDLKTRVGLAVFVIKNGLE